MKNLTINHVLAVLVTMAFCAAAVSIDVAELPLWGAGPLANSMLTTVANYLLMPFIYAGFVLSAVTTIILLAASPLFLVHGTNPIGEDFRTELEVLPYLYFVVYLFVRLRSRTDRSPLYYALIGCTAMFAITMYVDLVSKGVRDAQGGIGFFLSRHASVLLAVSVIEAIEFVRRRLGNT